MTIWEVFRVSRRLWVVVVIGLLLTAWATTTVRNEPGAYSGQARVTLLAPESIRGNAVARSPESMIALAGVIAHLTQGTGGDAQSVSNQVTLLGEGVRDGYSIRQPNRGGQWVNQFDDAALDVQSAGPTLNRAQEQMNAALNSINAALDSLQVGVPEDERVTTHLGPGDPAFTHENGSMMRATIATVLLGLILTFTAPMVVDRFQRRRATRTGASVRPSRQNTRSHSGSQEVHYHLTRAVPPP